MAPIYKVAVVQFEPRPNAVVENFNICAGYIRSAAQKGAHIVVLPEFHLTSWVPDTAGFVSATQESGSYLSKYQELARECAISIVPGTICEIHDLGDGNQEMRNMAYFISAGTGSIAGTYQKKNLWHPERPHLTSSGQTPHAAFDTPLKNADGKPVRAGMLICWDLAFPEAFRALVKDGAEIIIIPSWWYTDDVDEATSVNPTADAEFLQSATTLRAFENTAAIVFSNSGGLSGVSMPLLGTPQRIPVGKEDMIISVIDLDFLRVAEQKYKVRMDLARRNWHYGYSKTEDLA